MPKKLELMFLSKSCRWEKEIIQDFGGNNQYDIMQLIEHVLSIKVKFKGMT